MRRAWILVLTLAVFVLTALGAVAINAATSVEPPWPLGLDVLRRHPWQATAWLTGVGAVASLLLWWWQEKEPALVDVPPPPAARPVPEWVVQRPAEATELIRALRRRRGRGTAVCVTTAFKGAGGFGKTTLTSLVCASRPVRRFFRGRIYWITVGRDVRSPSAIAGKVNETLEFITGQLASFRDPDLAGDHLGRLLEQCPRTLLVIDDVWTEEQLTPFLSGGHPCTRLVTTRIPAVLPRGAACTLVDRMSHQQARRVLSHQLPPFNNVLLRRLMEATGRWPLLLRLVNRVIVSAVETGQPANDAAADVLAQLQRTGPVSVDQSEGVVLDDPRQRRKTVRATIEAGTRLLPGEGVHRYHELGIFAEDEVVPVPLVLRLWQATGGLSAAEGRRLCGQLAHLSLISIDPADEGALTLHDVVRDYVRNELGTQELANVHAALLDARRTGLSETSALVAGTAGPGAAWWELAETDGYLFDHLISHMLAAGRAEDAEHLTTDLRWVEARLIHRGALAPLNDLNLIPTDRAAARATALSRILHLLVPTDPDHVRISTLHNRLEGEPTWADQIRGRRATLTRHT